MMRVIAAAWALVFLQVSPCDAVAVEASASANPIRRVVTMLQSMDKKLEEENEEDQKLFDKFMCYCETSQKENAADIEKEEAALPQLRSDRDSATSQLKSTENALAANREDAKAAKESMSEATNSRLADHKKFQGELDEVQGYLDALSGAIPAIEQGTAGSFLQAATSQKLNQAIEAATSISDSDRSMLVNALTGQSEDGESYTPHSGEVLGILKTMMESFSKNKEQLESEEADAAKVYDELMRAKMKELDGLNAAIEREITKIGDFKVAIVQAKTDISEITEGLQKDYTLRKQLKEACEAKPKEWEARKESRSEEKIALRETIKVLNDDDALELFKKTLPSPSLIQVEGTKKAIFHKAAEVIRAMPKSLRKQFPQLDFISLSLMGKKTDFSTVMKMIDEMIKLLKKEQTTDYRKKDSCRDALRKAEVKKRNLDADIADIEDAIGQRKENIVNMKDSVRATQTGIEDLDKAVEAATNQRKEEHAEYVKGIQINSAAKDLLNVAETRLNKFYNPRLYKQTLTTTPPPDDFVNLLQETSSKRASIKVHDQQEPETWDKYQKKSNENTGVMELLASLIADLEKENQVNKVEEEDAQAEYEKTMADSADKRASDLEYIATQEENIANEEAGKADAEQEQRKEMKILEEEKKLITATHADCDFLVTNFDIRKQARTDEIESLNTAKKILAGADYSFIQGPKRLRGQ